jgi:DNA-binding transcriptional LysR family regulator
VCPGSLEWRLIDPLAKLLARHPGIRFDVNGASFERMIQQLRNGAVDVAVGFDAAFRDWPDVERQPAGELHTLIFARKGHPLLEEQIVTPEALARYPFVSPSDSRPYGAVVRDLYESQGVEWRTRVHVIDYFPTVTRIVASSDAVAGVSRDHAKSSAFQREFQVLPFDLFGGAPLCCAVRARWEPAPAARAFIKAMRDGG